MSNVTEPIKNDNTSWLTPGNTPVHVAVKTQVDKLFPFIPQQKSSDSYEKKTEDLASFRMRKGFVSQEEEQSERLKVLEAKSKRVHSKWNSIKRAFGFGEEMTAKEEAEYSNLLRAQRMQKLWDEENSQ